MIFHWYIWLPKDKFLGSFHPNVPTVLPIATSLTVSLLAKMGVFAFKTHWLGGSRANCTWPSLFLSRYSKVMPWYYEGQKGLLMFQIYTTYLFIYIYTSIHPSMHAYIHTYLHTLHYIALHCITLHCIPLHYITLHCITLHYITYIICIYVYWLCIYVLCSIYPSLPIHRKWPATTATRLAQGVQTQDGIGVAVCQQDSLKGNPGKKYLADVMADVFF